MQHDFTNSIVIQPEQENQIKSHKFTREIESIKFHISSPDEIKRRAVCEITSTKLVGENSVYDERMGVIANHVTCVTCGETNNICCGHSGYIELRTPIVHPLLHNEVVQFLECFCEKCSKLMLSNDEMKLHDLTRFKQMNRFKSVHNYITTSRPSKCPSCNHQNDNYIAKEGTFYKYLDDKNERVVLSVVEIENILGNIPAQDMKQCGLWHAGVVPVHFIIRILEVLPICARPFVESGNGICDDDLTTKYVEIVKVNNKIVAGNTEKERQDLASGLEFHVRTLMDNSKKQARQINSRPIKCIKERLNGKLGVFRNNLVAKRVDQSARTVIGPNANLRANEIAIPHAMASTLTFPENVAAFNIRHLEELVNTGRANFVHRGQKTFDLKISLKSRPYFETDGFKLQPGDQIVRDMQKIDPDKWKLSRGSQIEILPTDKVLRDGKLLKNLKLPERCVFELEYGDIVFRDGKKLDVWQASNKFNSFGKSQHNYEPQLNDIVRRNGVEINNIVPSKIKYFKLEIGDVVDRHLRDGDIVMFGRQPSLHVGSMISRHVRIIPHTNSINSGQPILTIQMNLAQCQSYNADEKNDLVKII